MIKTLKNSQVMAILYNLNNGKINTTEMPVAFLWAYKINYKKLQEIAKIYEEARKELGDLYSSDDKSYIEETMGEQEGNKSERKVRPEYEGDWIKDNQELLDQENEFDFKTVGIEILSDIKMTPSDFEILSEFMFEE